MDTHITSACFLRAQRVVQAYSGKYAGIKSDILFQKVTN